MQYFYVFILSFIVIYLPIFIYLIIISFMLIFNNSFFSFFKYDFLYYSYYFLMIMGAYNIIKKKRDVDIKYLIKLIIYIIIFYIDYILKLYYLLGGFTLMIDLYFDIYKFKSLKETFKSLTINFYNFIIGVLILFALKIYFLINNIEVASLYYLFLTIPTSLLVIYFYTKDLGPIISELKEVNKDSEIKLKETSGENK